jgi:hypothetical protein
MATDLNSVDRTKPVRSRSNESYPSCEGVSPSSNLSRLSSNRRSPAFVIPGRHPADGDSKPRRRHSHTAQSAHGRGDVRYNPRPEDGLCAVQAGTTWEKLTNTEAQTRPDEDDAKILAPDVSFTRTAPKTSQHVHPGRTRMGPTRRSPPKVPSSRASALLSPFSLSLGCTRR